MRRLTLAMAVGALLVPVLAHASCIESPETGRWVNVDPASRGLARIEVRFVCQDVVINGKLYPPGAPWYVRVFARCGPVECDWGEIAAQRMESGHVYATYDVGFARRTVYTRMSEFRPGLLWVYVWTDFTDPNRPDYAINDWFKREGRLSVSLPAQPGPSSR
jgi:hypothetical protein